jgi:hypothetical protein
MDRVFSTHGGNDEYMQDAGRNGRRKEVIMRTQKRPSDYY